MEYSGFTVPAVVILSYRFAFETEFHIL